MKKDRVLHPVNKGRASGIKSPKSGIIESFTPSLESLTPYNREGKKKKK